MNIIEILFSGIVGVLLGAWLGAWWSYGFQKKLLAQQLEFQKGLLDQQLTAEQKQHEEYLKFLDKAALNDATSGLSLRTQLHTELGAIEKAITSLKQ